jgi:hypothetical protein
MLRSGPEKQRLWTHHGSIAMASTMRYYAHGGGQAPTGLARNATKLAGISIPVIRTTRLVGENI